MGKNKKRMRRDDSSSTDTSSSDDEASAEGTPRRSSDAHVTTAARRKTTGQKGADEEDDDCRTRNHRRLARWSSVSVKRARRGKKEESYGHMFPWGNAMDILKDIKKDIKTIKKDIKELKEINKGRKQLNKVTESNSEPCKRGGDSSAPRSESDQLQRPPYRLEFECEVKEVIDKGQIIQTKDHGETIRVGLYDNNTNQLVQTGLLASATVLLVVVDGEFNKYGNRISWSREEFKMNIRRPPPKNSAIRDMNESEESIVSKGLFQLDHGSKNHSGATILCNSSNKKVRLGVMVLSPTGERVLEGLSNPFFVRGHDRPARQSNKRKNKSKEQRPNPSTEPLQHPQNPVALSEVPSTSPLMVQDQFSDPTTNRISTDQAMCTQPPIGGEQLPLPSEKNHDEPETVPANVLPPGFRFLPTDEELIVHYLVDRHAATPCPVPMIAEEVDIYKFNPPWELPPSVFAEERYFFCRDADSFNLAGTSYGYWKPTSPPQEVILTFDCGRIGFKETLVFYTWCAPDAIRTVWIMHKYRLDYNYAWNPNGIQSAENINSWDVEWVLCKIYNETKQQQQLSPFIQKDLFLRSEHEEFPRLPPGFRFRPTDYDLIYRYLRNSTTSAPFLTSVIAKFDNIADSDPLNLVEKAELIASSEWYFLTRIQLDHATAAGRWMSTGELKKITAADNELVGYRKTLVFHDGPAANLGLVTWTMHEYRLASNTDVNGGTMGDSSTTSITWLNDWVLYKLFRRDMVYDDEYLTSS